MDIHPALPLIRFGNVKLFVKSLNFSSKPDANTILVA